MSTYLAPGVYVEEKSSGIKPIEGVSTSVGAFIGVSEKGPVNKATLVTSFSEFVKIFGGPIKIISGTQEYYLYYAVKHFFTEGGTRCYVVRIVHYDDINDDSDSSITAKKASANFDGKDIYNNPASPALIISALNEGTWGESLKVQVENSSKYSLLLKEDINATTDVTQMSLVDNSDVQVGSLLWIIEEVTGIVQSVNRSNNEITFKETGLRTGDQDFNAQIDVGIKVFSPDFKFITTNQSPVTVTDGDPSSNIILRYLKNIDNTELKNGDVLNFALKEALVIVKKISSKTLLSGEKIMVVEFESQDFTRLESYKPNIAFEKDYSKVYARDFTIKVKENGSDSILETHENLSLVDTNISDYIGERLSQESGKSFYIFAEKDQQIGGVLVDNTPFASLSGGNDGRASLVDSDYIGSELTQTGLYALDVVKDASILIIPNASQVVTSEAINKYCYKRKDLFYIIDYPNTRTNDIDVYRSELSTSNYAAIYYPWIKITDPFTGKLVSVPPSGAIAGIYANTDVKRGVHKAPAGVEEGYLNSAVGIDEIITKSKNDTLYQQEINVIRKFPEGIIVWGARTISQDAEWKYINVRRLFMFLEKSLEIGTQWVVFEPNDSTLWKNIKRNVSAFLRIQWLEGKLVGETEAQAFYVKCDGETNPQEVIDAGQVITEIGVAPSKPAEFVVFRIKQFTGLSTGA